jgi:ribonucleoside-diphosphate reductase beta chain
LLDTIQATIGDVAQIKNALTDHEQIIYANFAFMVGVHARSYGTIFSTLCSSQQIEEAHQWVVDNEALQQRAKELIPYYISDDPLESKIAAAFQDFYCTVVSTYHFIYQPAENFPTHQTSFVSS